MPEKDDIEEQEAAKPVQRLCSEIQLFDLCDLERCYHKKERYCTNEELLTRFERISEKDDTRLVSDTYLSEGPDDEEEPDDDVYGEGLNDRDDDDRDDWDEE